MPKYATILASKQAGNSAFLAWFKFYINKWATTFCFKQRVVAFLCAGRASPSPTE